MTSGEPAEIRELRRKIRSWPPSGQAVQDAALTGVLAGIYESDERGRRRPESLDRSLRAWGHLIR